MYRANLAEIIRYAYEDLKDAPEVPVNRWQAVATEGHFKEVVNFSFESPIPGRQVWLAEVVKPNLPWAEDHFQERVGGEPLNPGVQYRNWPFWTAGAEASMRRVDGKFSHTYMERFWPKFAGNEHVHYNSPDEPQSYYKRHPMLGVRYRYGDLNDVVQMLHNDPHTRQAYVPIWFPEDTGGAMGERVPCSLGYHFMMRENQLHCWYFIRSVDFVHYLRDDIYMACRLCQWLLHQLQNEHLAHPDFWYEVTPGNLYMTVCSLHVFGKDFRVLDS